MKIKELKLQHILYLILGCGFLFHDMNLIAQDYPFKRYRVSDGLSQSQGTMIYNDSRGYIWIGTRNGLSRFDGIDFINYSKKDGLPSNMIKAVFEDQARQLWVETIEGLSRYTGNGFIFYTPGNCLNEGKSFEKLTITGDSGKILILRDHNLILFDNGTYTDLSEKDHLFDTLKLIDIHYDKPSGKLFLIDNKGIIWVYREGILTKISDEIFSQFLNLNNKLLATGVDSISEYQNGKLVPYKMSCKKGSKEVFFAHNEPGHKIKYFDGYRHDEFNLPFRPTDICLDAQGTVWFSTENDIYRLQSTAFATLKKGINTLEDIWTICKDRNDHLWLGTIDGDLFEYDGIKYTKHNEYKKLFPDCQNPVFYKGSRTLSNGETWLSLSEGILIWNGTSFRRYKGITEKVQVCFIYEDPDNHKVMIGTNKGLFVEDRGITSRYSRFTDNDLGIIEGITKDKLGFYWLSGHKGVVIFDGIYVTKVHDAILPKVWTNNIETDSLGGIWVSSDDGLFCKKSSDSTFYAGLPSTINRPVGSLKILNKSTLLVGRGGDICLIDLGKYYAGQKDYFRIYDKSDGYPGDECLDNGIIKGDEGTFLILTSENIIKFYPDRLHKDLLPPKINFTGISFENDSLAFQPFCTDNFYFGINSNIRFSRRHNNIKITYTGISTSNPEKVRYIYWLEGLDKSWSLPSDKREIVYQNLLPGKYCFHLKGINADGVENSTSSDLTFSIAPSFYETILFRVVSILSLIFVTIFITRHYLRKSQLVREEKQRVSSELLRLQINSVIKEFDPHFTFNAISSLGSLIMTGDNTEAYSYLTKLSSMLRTAMSDESVVIKPLRDEIEFVTNYLELQKLRFGDRFTYNIKIDENIDLEKVIPKMTIQTFVENSVKHGLESQKKCGWIEIAINHKESNTKIIIKDNGIGRKASVNRRTAGFGFGIKTVKRIFEILNQDNHSKSSIKINDLTENGILAGTEVVITIPDEFSFNNSVTLTDKMLE